MIKLYCYKHIIERYERQVPMTTFSLKEVVEKSAISCN